MEDRTSLATFGRWILHSYLLNPYSYYLQVKPLSGGDGNYTNIYLNPSVKDSLRASLSLPWQAKGKETTLEHWLTKCIFISYEQLTTAAPGHRLSADEGTSKKHLALTSSFCVQEMIFVVDSNLKPTG